jgi:hypothetical protein
VKRQCRSCGRFYGNWNPAGGTGNWFFCSKECLGNYAEYVGGKTDSPAPKKKIGNMIRKSREW